MGVVLEISRDKICQQSHLVYRQRKRHLRPPSPRPQTPPNLSSVASTHILATVKPIPVPSIGVLIGLGRTFQTLSEARLLESLFLSQ